MINDIIDHNVLFISMAVTISYFYLTDPEKKINEYYK